MESAEVAETMPTADRALIGRRGNARWDHSHLVPLSEGIKSGEQIGKWEITATPARFEIPGPFETGWYHLRVAIRSFSRFTVQKRCELVFEGAGGTALPSARETFAWNRNVTEELVLRLNRRAQRLRLDLHHVEGLVAFESLTLRRLSSVRVAALAVREKLRLIRAYRCTGPVLWRGAGLLLRGQWRRFRAKLLKGLTDGRVIRRGSGHNDELDAAWWRRHTLTREEAERIAQDCDSWNDPLPLAVILPVDPGQIDTIRWTAHSIRRQIYPHWELYLVTAGPPGVVPHLQQLLNREPRVHVIRVPQWAGLATAVAKALSATNCQWTVILTPGIELAEHALYHGAKRLLADPTLEGVGLQVHRFENNNQTDLVVQTSRTSLQDVPAHEERTETDTAYGKTEGTNKLKLPSTVWAVATTYLARQIPSDLTACTMGIWVESLAFTKSAVLEPPLAYPVEERPLFDHARIGRKPSVRGTPLYLSTDLRGISGYDHLAYAVLKGLPSLGVQLRWHQVSSIRQELMPRGMTLPMGGWKPGDKQLIISPPFLAHRFQPDGASALFTMWETDYLEPHWVEMMNRCCLVIVPSQWGADCFRRCGVKVPIEVVPLGYDPVVYHAGDGTFPEICTFGTAGALAAGGLRKNAQLVIEVFRRAFPHEANVRLRVKITPESTALETYDDPRIEVLRTVLPSVQVAEWYRSLTAYVNASAGEGFGLHLLEAMACGRPLITTAYSGLTAFFDESVGYCVSYRLVPVHNAIYSGHWAEPDEESLIAQMRRVYSCPAEVRQFGMRAAARASRFTWREAGRQLRNVLVKHGFLD